MKRKKTARSSSNLPMSPIHPSMHFVLFLIMAFFLVVGVAFALQQTAKNTRANLVCPQQNEDPTKLIEHLSGKCQNGVTYTKDVDGCGTWVCK